MAGIVLEFDRNPNLSDVERLQSFMESVQRAFNELEITHDDLELEKHPLMMSISKENQDFRVLFNDYGEFKVITANAIEAVKGDFKNVYAELIKADKIIVEDLRTAFLEADAAVIKQLSGDLANYKIVMAEELLAVNGRFEQIETDYLKAADAELGYVAIDKANIDDAWIEDLLVKGNFLANDVNAGTGSFSKFLVGVKIYGDHIVGGTISTERLIIRDPDNNTGILYEINNGVVDQTNLTADQLKRLTLDGKIITAESITADKINVYDLFAQNILSTGDFNMGGKGALVYDSETDDLSIRVSSLTIGTTAAATKGDVKDLQDYVNDNEIRAAATMAELKTKMEMLEGQINMKVEQSDVEALTENMKIGSRNLIRNSKDLIFNKHHFGHGAHKPFRLRRPVIRIEEEKLSAPVIRLLTEVIIDTRTKLKAPKISVSDKLERPVISIMSKHLDAPVIRIETGSAGKTAVLGYGVLGNMVLGDESRLTAPNVYLTDITSDVLGEAVLGEMILGEQ